MPLSPVGATSSVGGSSPLDKLNTLVKNFNNSTLAKNGDIKAEVHNGKLKISMPYGDKGKKLRWPPSKGYQKAIENGDYKGVLNKATQLFKASKNAFDKICVNLKNPSSINLKFAKDNKITSFHATYQDFSELKGTLKANQVAIDTLGVVGKNQPGVGGEKSKAKTVVDEFKSLQHTTTPHPPHTPPKSKEDEELEFNSATKEHTLHPPGTRSEESLSFSRDKPLSAPASKTVLKTTEKEKGKTPLENLQNIHKQLMAIEPRLTPQLKGTKVDLASDLKEIKESLNDADEDDVEDIFRDFSQLLNQLLKTAVLSKGRSKIQELQKQLKQIKE